MILPWKVAEVSYDMEMHGVMCVCVCGEGGREGMRGERMSEGAGMRASNQFKLGLEGGWGGGGVGGWVEVGVGTHDLIRGPLPTSFLNRSDAAVEQRVRSGACQTPFREHTLDTVLLFGPKAHGKLMTEMPDASGQL